MDTVLASLSPKARTSLIVKIVHAAGARHKLVRDKNTISLVNAETAKAVGVEVNQRFALNDMTDEQLEKIAKAFQVKMASDIALRVAARFQAATKA